jgi:RNA recognition motif-containing protein
VILLCRKSAKIVKIEDENSWGYGFVEVSNENEAEDAIRRLDHHNLLGKLIRVKPAHRIFFYCALFLLDPKPRDHRQIVRVRDNGYRNLVSIPLSNDNPDDPSIQCDVCHQQVPFSMYNAHSRNHMGRVNVINHDIDCSSDNDDEDYEDDEGVSYNNTVVRPYSYFEFPPHRNIAGEEEGFFYLFFNKYFFF